MRLRQMRMLTMNSYRPPESQAQLDGSPRRRYYTGRNLKRVQAISDLRARTHRLMPRFVLEYLEGGAGQEATLDRERACFADWWILPRTMVDESRRDVSSQVLEETWRWLTRQRHVRCRSRKARCRTKASRMSRR